MSGVFQSAGVGQTIGGRSAVLRGSGHSLADKSSGAIVKPPDLAIVEERRKKIGLGPTYRRGAGTHRICFEGDNISCLSTIMAKAEIRGVFFMF